MTRNVTKVLAAMEDLFVGRGAVSQVRNGNTVTVHGIDVAFAVDTVVDMQALDVAKYRRARVYSSVNNYMTYVYDPTDNTGITSDTGSGTWVEVPESESAVVTQSKPDLRNEEPAYNYQLGVALGGSSLNTGDGAVYYYNPNSTAVDDGDDVLVTPDGARWLKFIGSTAASVGAEYVEATGGVNNLEISMGLSSVPEDQVIFVKAANTNTGAATLKLDALSPLPLQTLDDVALQAGMLETGKVYAVLFSAVKAYVLQPSASQILANAGADNKALMTPLRVKQYVLNKVQEDASVPGLATDNQSIVSPALLYKILANASLDFGMDIVGTKTELRVDPGIAQDSTETQSIVLTSALSKSPHDPWTAGGSGGMRPAGVTYGDCEWMYVFVISKPDGTADIGMDNNPNATNLLVTATGYTLFKWIGIWINAVDNVVATKGGFDGEGNYAKHRRDKNVPLIRLSISVTVPFSWPPEHNSAKIDLVGGGADTTSAGDTEITVGTVATPVVFTANGGSPGGGAGSFTSDLAFPGFLHGGVGGRKGVPGNGSTLGGYAKRTSTVNSVSESAPGTPVDSWGAGGPNGGGGGGWVSFYHSVTPGEDSSLVVGAKGGTGQDAATDPNDSTQLGGWPGNIVIEL